MEARLVTMPELVEEFLADQTRRHEEWKSRQGEPRPPARVKVYRRHYCSRKHKRYSALAKCLWKRAVWISGEGPFALLAYCRALTITLHQTLESAEQSKAQIDATGCGGFCHESHEIIRLVDPAEAEGE